MTWQKTRNTPDRRYQVSFFAACKDELRRNPTVGLTDDTVVSLIDNTVGRIETNQCRADRAGHVQTTHWQLPNYQVQQVLQSLLRDPATRAKMV